MINWWSLLKMSWIKIEENFIFHRKKMCATEEQFLRLNSTASINLNPKICYFLRVPWQPSCFWNTIWHVTIIHLAVPIVPADLAHAAPDVRVHHDDQQRHEDQVGVAEDIFQQQKLKPVQMIKAEWHRLYENKPKENKLSTWRWPPRPGRDWRGMCRWWGWPARIPGTGASACAISPPGDSWSGGVWWPGKPRDRPSVRALGGQG